jgi:hypothetical protein
MIIRVYLMERKAVLFEVGVLESTVYGNLYEWYE